MAWRNLPPYLTGEMSHIIPRHLPPVPKGVDKQNEAKD